jgi:hypothetical protein
MERAIRACCAERSVDWVERDSVDGIDVGHVILGGVAVALEGEVRAIRAVLV